MAPKESGLGLTRDYVKVFGTHEGNLSGTHFGLDGVSRATWTGPSGLVGVVAIGQ
ncbi:hypothetical protein GCM10027057_20140 [Marisediminicola antarctica]